MVLQTTTQEDVGIQKMLITGMVPGIVGYMIPKYWVTKRLQKRQEEIENGLPDALDMTLVCVEAGQSMDQSIIRVSEEIAAGIPALAEEFAIVAHEMKAGKDKTQVLKVVQDVGSFVTVLVQSQQFGTSIAEALRVYASEMRDNLRKALAQMENPAYDDPQEEAFKLVRRGSSEYLIEEFP